MQILVRRQQCALAHLADSNSGGVNGLSRCAGTREALSQRPRWSCADTTAAMCRIPTPMTDLVAQFDLYIACCAGGWKTSGFVAWYQCAEVLSD